MDEGASLTHLMTKLILQLGVIIISAKVLGYLFSKYLKQSSVLGELIAGMIIGPYALGGIPLAIFENEALFTIPLGSALPVSPELYGLATLSSIVLLFFSGLGTDMRIFLRFAGIGSLVGIGGFLGTFFLAVGATVFFVPGVESFMDPRALFMGGTTATSAGITARILSEKHQLSSPEGVTILTAAVLDDVLGIVVLSIIVGLIHTTSSVQSHFAWGPIGLIAAKAFGFWIASTILGILLAPYITKGLKSMKDMGNLAFCAFGLALLLAGISEMMGLAMVIGAYVMGLSFSSTDVAEDIRQRLEGLYNFIVPVFFCVMGMMVDFSVIPKVIQFGTIYVTLGLLGKIIGAGGVSFLGGFNWRGALRIGVGMVPRGEVALIVAGVGLASGVLDASLFGVVVMLVFISCIVSPPAIVKAFSGASGFKGNLAHKSREKIETISLDLPNEHLAQFVLKHFVTAFRQAEFFPRRIHSPKPNYMIQKDAVHIMLTLQESKVVFDVPVGQISLVRLLITEELLNLKDFFKNVDILADSDSMERQMIGDLFGASEKSDDD